MFATSLRRAARLEVIFRMVFKEESWIPLGIGSSLAAQSVNSSTISCERLAVSRFRTACKCWVRCALSCGVSCPVKDFDAGSHLR